MPHVRAIDSHYTFEAREETEDCWYCGAPVENGQRAVRIDGDLAHPECVNEQWHYSEYSDCVIRDANAVFTTRGWVDRETYCEEFAECQNCGDRHYNDDMIYENDEVLCETCYRENRSEDECVIMGYHAVNVARQCGFEHSLNPRGTGAPQPNTAYYGVENEVEMRHRDGNAQEKAEEIAEVFNALLPCEVNSEIARTRQCVFEHDGSLNNGFEIISRPMTLDRARKYWGERLTKENMKGLRSSQTETCGCHIHVSRRAFTPLQLGKILVFFNSEFNADFLKTIAQRRPQHMYKMKTKRLTSIDDGDRYQYVNLTNSATIEFRMFRGTLRADRMLKNLEFVAAAREFVNDTPYTNLRFPDFINWMKRAENSASYPALRAFLIETGWLTETKKARPTLDVNAAVAALRT